MFQAKNLVGSMETPTVLRWVLGFLNPLDLTKFPGMVYCRTSGSGERNPEWQTDPAELLNQCALEQ